MRFLLISTLLTLTATTTTMGCAKKSHIATPASSASSAIQKDGSGKPGNPDAANPLFLSPESLQGKNEDIPKVVRRILREEKDLVNRSIIMASDLPDPTGKQRALKEANELRFELTQIEAPLEKANSEELDQIVQKLLLIDTRIALLHESLRTATNHTTAVVVDQ
jgi:hypothetical protein